MGAAKTFEEYIAKRKTMPFFSNARTVRNAMDRARMNSAIRIFNEGISGKEVSVKDLKTITGSDFQIILDETSLRVTTQLWHKKYRCILPESYLEVHMKPLFSSLRHY